MSGHHAPVTDWSSDFDHTDPAWIADPYPIWETIRQRECPVAHTERYGGTWLPVTHADVSAIAYDTEHFTSQSVLVAETRPGVPAPQGIAPPISSDPPFHHDARRLLLPAFSPKEVARLEAFTRDFCHELIDAIDPSATVDAAVEYAQHIPVRVIAKMLGFPEDDADKFRSFIHHALESVDQPAEERIANFVGLDTYLREQIDDHRAHPRDDLTTYLLNAELGGQPLNENHVGGTISLLLIAGIDTTWSAIGASIWHLARTPGDRSRLATEPDLLDTAVEEFLRAYAPVTMARLVKEEIDFRGCPMQPGEWVLLPFPAANRDPAAFDQPDEVLIDRAENRHAAFGLGIHRCAGSNLARMEMRVALEVWMERFPNFELADAAAVEWSGGQVRGPRVLPLRILGH